MTNNNDFGINFDLPKHQSNVIKVIGVGGGGSNAINHMYKQGIKGVDFVICNTDAQALQNSSVPNKIQLGINLTEGLGAGANPDVGEEAALESIDDIKRMLETNTKMVFITAGMGGGTGTGAAPIIAKAAMELDILTVGIVTMPFQFEGKSRNEQAQLGIEKFRSHVDSLIIINNNKLREVYGNLGYKSGFSKADEVLATASRGIAEVITHHYIQNIDLRDAKTVLSNSGTAIMGSAEASGPNRAQDAIMKALDSPLLNDNKITGAKNVLLLIVSGSDEITLDEIGEINDHIQTEAGHSANIIMGVGEDEKLEDSIAVTIIATGFDVHQQNELSNTEEKKVIHSLIIDDTSNNNKVNPTQQATSNTISSANEKTKNAPKPVIHTLEEKPISITLNVNEKTSIEHQIDADSFIINDVTPTSEDIVDEFEATENQIELSFDLPLPNTNTTEVIDEDTKNATIESNTEVNNTNKTRYQLEDFQNENKPNDSAQVYDSIEIKKTASSTAKTNNTEDSVNIESNDADPFNAPISQILKDRAIQRRQKMKEFNYKFNPVKIDAIEKEPAYKRQGVSIDNSKLSDANPNNSRLSVGEDDNDDLQLRRNNSFLHDNVD